LTFQEILSSDIGGFGEDEQYAQLGIEIVDNTPEEISSMVMEMEQRLAGTWQTTEEDEELRARFWALFPPRYPNRIFRSRVGAEFLRQNRDLLD
jgi:putative glycosyltransferase (TIGR04372 family)